MRHLTLSEINDIVIATFRAHRRHNERLIGSLEVVDRMFESIRNNGLSMNDRQWEVTDEAVDAAGGQNLTMPGVRAAFNAMAEPMGYTIELMDAINEEYYGYIWLYSDAVVMTIASLGNELDPAFTYMNPDYAQYARQWGESMTEYAQRMVLFILSHERRHSCQQFESLMAEYDGVTPENLAEVHDSLACEIDANNFGAYQTLGDYGTYRYAF